MLLRVKLAQLAEEHTHTDRDAPSGKREASPATFELKREEDEASGATSMELTLDGAPIAPPDDVKALLTSIQLDLGQIPDEYLTAAGPGEYDPSLYEEQAHDPNDVWQGTYHEIGAELYDEWDFGRQHYRKNWCVMREKEVAPVYDDFVKSALDRYSGLVKHLRRSFEAMRDENKLFKRQPYGDEVDIDALVEALADANDGREMSDRLFTRMHRAERNIAVMFMVDMSGSTRGWINDAERESLILLCEALETLGDRYAIYGFSGQTRKRCELYKIKEIDEPYNELVKARISGIRPQDYTRMGFAIRHLSKLLTEVEARTKLLITISDGKPDDYFDIYRGQYGIEDTRQALIEAKRAGIHSFCITIDKEARDYLPHMYGAAHYAIIDDVRRLPLKVADIYRRLTT
jgi:nitric oxide reductase NorD protein